MKQLRKLRIPNKRVFLSKVLLASLLLSTLMIAPQAHAAQVTSLSDTLSRIKASTLANHTIIFVTPTGIAAGNTITLTPTGFTGTNSIAFGDVDFATGSSGTCSSATYTEQTLAASPSGATWGVASSGGVTTITSGTGTLTAGFCLRIKIGTNAVTGTTGTNQLTNPAAGSASIAIGGTFGDSGTVAMSIISDDQVAITATVSPTITFTLGANTICFGTLNVGSARYANTTSCPAGGSNSEVSAHTFTAATNATNGFSVTVQGATLTSGANTIPAFTTVGGSDVTATNGFGIHVTASGGSGTIDSDYSGTSPNKYYYGGSASTADTIGSSTGPSATTTYTAYYGANVSATQQAGSYSATITYICTGNY